METGMERPTRLLKRDAAAALRSELEKRGYKTGRDTAGLGSGLYVTDERGLARALFEFKETVEEAFSTMYQGSWVVGLPPRFAVIPLATAAEEGFDLLEQARIGVLFCEVVEERVGFPHIESVLEIIGPPGH
jgi:hypothetical protein